MKSGWRQDATRWIKFNAVGALGIVVQFGVLMLLTRLCNVGYMLATACAVEAAVLQNYFWHERFTWVDRPAPGLGSSLKRLAAFNLSNGLISLAGNLMLMRLLVGQLGMPVLAANALSIAGCSVANFLASDRWVFVESGSR